MITKVNRGAGPSGRGVSGRTPDRYEDKSTGVDDYVRFFDVLEGMAKSFLNWLRQCCLSCF